MAIHSISEHQFPPSPQSDLFNYLRPEQQEFVKPILRVLKKPAQEELCCALLDYLESGEVIPPADIHNLLYQTDFQPLTPHPYENGSTG